MAGKVGDYLHFARRGPPFCSRSRTPHREQAGGLESIFLPGLGVQSLPSPRPI